MKELIHVRSGLGNPLRNGDGFTDTIEQVWRIPRQHSGWQSVQYKGKRYQLHGGIRTPHFITVK